jgi:hypothetical protein
MLGRQLLVFAVVTASSVPIVGCNDDDTELDARRRTTSGITFVETYALLQRGPKRVHLELDAEEGERQILRVIEIQEDHLLFNDERIFGRLDAGGLGEVTEEACQGTLSLGVPGLEVRFDQAVTRFEENGSELSCTEFASRVSEIVEADQRPWIVASRGPTRFPPAPGEGAFFARTLRLADDDASDDARPLVQINLGPANLSACDAAPGATDDCVGALEMLGETFVASRERTAIGTEFPQEIILADLDGQRVRGVSLETRELMLADGTVVRLLDGTRVEGADEEVADDVIVSLEQVRDAIGEGAAVQLGGDAVVPAGSPLALLGTELSMRRIEEPAEELDEIVSIQGLVNEVGADGQSFTLEDGTEIRITGDTEIEGELGDLAAVSEAIADDTRVRADILGRMDTAAPTMSVEARVVRFLIELPGNGALRPGA